MTLDRFSPGVFFLPVGVPRESARVQYRVCKMAHGFRLLWAVGG